MQIAKPTFCDVISILIENRKTLSIRIDGYTTGRSEFRVLTDGQHHNDHATGSAVYEGIPVFMWQPLRTTYTPSSGSTGFLTIDPPIYNEHHRAGNHRLNGFMLLNHSTDGEILDRMYAIPDTFSLRHNGLLSPKMYDWLRQHAVGPMALNVKLVNTPRAYHLKEAVGHELYLADDNIYFHDEADAVMVRMAVQSFGTGDDNGG